MNTQPLKKNISSYIIQTHEEEIKRIAMELHEGVGQSLYSLFTGMQLIEKEIEQPAMKSYAGDMNQLLEKTIQEIRLLAVELHPPTLTTLGLISALKSYIKLYTSTYGIEVEVENLGVESKISDRESITLFRVCQEALVNIARYADTMKASILFKWKKSRLLIMIKDSGKGFEVETAMNKSSGLAAMSERMHLIGGKCFIFSKIDEGTSIEISLPLY
ncbi:sensor histidine kinase [Peribacillus sp. CSMR9]|uniref:sensor histidine kinase n=1 Tax=Peribacillus sp. CSMR9 TaxID=2981350 RepID=UPI002952DF50|nr:sensor histidine kinase [Peribacillus sp. CSMR9]MDV7766648.1 sensor histidine kinase [Peribacillus sp. CSMR9]